MENTHVVERKLTKKDIWKLYLYSQAFCCGYNYEKQEAPGFTFSMMPVIEKVYGNDQDKIDAYRRHTELFLTEGTVSHLIIGITAAMEEENSKSEDFNPDSINAIKVALMGPFAGIGDSLIYGTLRPLIAGLAISMITASKYTSAWGSLMFVLIMGGVSLIGRYFGIFKGYEKGIDLVSKIQSSGIIQKFTKYAGMAACIVIGGWVSAFVWFNIPWTYVTGETTVSLQNTLDGIMPNMLPLILVLTCYNIISKKKMSPVMLMIVLMVIGVILSMMGIIA